jgi:hypothetical protein
MNRVDRSVLASIISCLLPFGIAACSGAPDGAEAGDTDRDSAGTTESAFTASHVQNQTPPRPPRVNWCVADATVATVYQEADTCAGIVVGNGGFFRRDYTFRRPDGTLPEERELRKFCTYAWTSTSLQAYSPPDMSRVPGPARADCLIVAALNGSAGTFSVGSAIGNFATSSIGTGSRVPQIDLRLDPWNHPWAFQVPPGENRLVLEQLHATFVRAAGIGTRPPQPQTAPERVRVGVLDTSPDSGVVGPAARGYYDHGYNVGRVIRELACPNENDGAPDCVAGIDNTLALPHTQQGAQATGGYVGTTADLARAIDLAVHKWRTARAERRLVINISAGWDPIWGAGEPNANPGAGAVLQALRVAACHGALTLAAAGNKPGAVGTDGAVYPAAYEALTAPTRAECAALGVRVDESRGPIFDSDPRAAQLVYAVGGVDAMDRPLTNTRPRGRPRLVAYADHVVARSTDGPRPLTTIMTGSSMSTAVASGIAAAVWGRAPQLRPHEVVRHMYARAVDISRGGTVNASFPPESNAGIRRLSYCEAVWAAQCRDGSCTAPARCATTASAYRGTSPRWTESWANLSRNTWPGRATARRCSGTACSNPTTRLATSSVVPWVHPLPSPEGGCGGMCGVNGSTGYFDFGSTPSEFTLVFRNVGEEPLDGYTIIPPRTGGLETAFTVPLVVPATAVDAVIYYLRDWGSAGQLAYEAPVLVW